MAKINTNIEMNGVDMKIKCEHKVLIITQPHFESLLFTEASVSQKITRKV